MTDFKVGQRVWLPFWVLLDYISGKPSAPFIACKIVTIGPRSYVGGDGKHTGKMIMEVADLQLADDLTAYAIPTAYLIKEDDLYTWAKRIGDWFSDFKLD